MEIKILAWDGHTYIARCNQQAHYQSPFILFTSQLAMYYKFSIGNINVLLQ